MIKAILWDNDGVLVDTERLYFRATQEILSSIGFELSEKQFLDLFLIEARGVWHLVQEKGFSPEQVEALRQERNKRYGEYLAGEHLLMEGVEEVLSELHGKFHMGIVTSSLREHFDVIHSSSGLLKYFDFVVAAGDYTKYKPDPEPYLVALEKANVQSEECIAIEDSLRGLLSATRAGIRCYVVPHHLTSGSDFSAAYKVLTHIREIVPELLKQKTFSRSGRAIPR
jgi:HAD superfamily hydrolase (TIGR01509 family)